MSRRPRRNHAPAFKAKVALAAIKGEATLVERQTMIDRTHALPITRQAAALGISRGSVYYVPRPVADADLALMRLLDAVHLEFPYAGIAPIRSCPTCSAVG